MKCPYFTLQRYKKKNTIRLSADTFIVSASILIVSADSLIVLEVGQVGRLGLVGLVGLVGDSLGGLGVGQVRLVGQVRPVRAPNQWQPSTPPHGGGGGGFIPSSRLFIIFAP
ncbi:hypothetical protein FHS60_001262 [Alloprevotella rava]|uniref:Uncharacterized protein n=1 Tax=Alloprevotella rava TaxID=671218 RepID=A0A7W5UJV2_9BACT|nr:hypothetical protein [Alloprevotella rava]